MADPIDVYLSERLAPQLAARALAGEQIAVLLEDVRSRLASVVCRWHDVVFRRTILHIGMEGVTSSILSRRLLSCAPWS